MARPATTPARRTTAPPEPVEETNIYTELWEAITENDPKFPAPNDKESDQDFYKRVVRAVAAVPIETWNTLSVPAQEWYDNAAGDMEAGNDIAALPGYADPEDEADEAEGVEEAEEAAEGDVEEEPAEEAAPAASPREAARQRMIDINAKRRAEKAGNGTPPVPARRGAVAAAAPVRKSAPPSAPARRGAPVAGAAPARRGAAPAAAPARKTAAPVARKKAAEPSGPSNMEVIRQLIVQDPTITVDEIINHVTEQGLTSDRFTASRNTITGVLTTTRATIQTIKALNHWK